MRELDQILNAINVGLVTLDPGLQVRSWNHWMETHSGIPRSRIVGAPLFRFYPELDNPAFVRNCRSVLNFGSFAFFSQKIHHHLFPFKPTRSLGARLERMQQSCVMGPIREEDGRVSSLFLVVQDVTELVAYEHRLREMNLRDGLTGAYNRRYLDHRLAVEFERFQRYGRPLSLVLADVDLFKSVNDRFGHACGDAVLKGVATDLAAGLRKADLVARYGGEEFCGVLPETDVTGALVAAEKMRVAAEARSHSWEGQPVPVTISIGVAEATAAMTSAGELLARADASLYQAKRSGRNRVVAFRDGDPVTARGARAHASRA